MFILELKNRRKGSRRRIRSDKEVRLCKFENNSHCFFQVLTQIDKVHNPKCLQHIFHDTWTAFGHRDKSWFIWCGCLNKSVCTCNCQDAGVQTIIANIYRLYLFLKYQSQVKSHVMKARLLKLLPEKDISSPNRHSS